MPRKVVNGARLAALVLACVFICPGSRACALASPEEGGGPRALHAACISSAGSRVTCTRGAYVSGLRAVPARGAGLAHGPITPTIPEDRKPRFWLPDKLETSWGAPDKKVHFFACYSIVLTGRTSSGETGPGVVAAAVLSVGKELWDLWFKFPASHRGVSKRDLVADAVGIAAAVVVAEWLGE
ncbi:MAG: hypothetical protein JSW03_07005 [Candidatus Eiseniibacteriota bacterium]|nr:MAG: hypothetical protein JSW03_07005 [Candidatus Eisenbacteria bacterium]